MSGLQNYAQAVPFPHTRIRKTMVYVSGPLTSGLMTDNVRLACVAGSVLRANGFATYVPHPSILWEMIVPRPAGHWLGHDLEAIRYCDLLFRRPGASAGSDREVQWALELGIPVYLNLQAIVEDEAPQRAGLPPGLLETPHPPILALPVSA